MITKVTITERRHTATRAINRCRQSATGLVLRAKAAYPRTLVESERNIRMLAKRALRFWPDSVVRGLAAQYPLQATTSVVAVAENELLRQAAIRWERREARNGVTTPEGVIIDDRSEAEFNSVAGLIAEEHFPYRGPDQLPAVAMAKAIFNLLEAVSVA